jgi:hypothetical protein
MSTVTDCDYEMESKIEKRQLNDIVRVSSKRMSGIEKWKDETRKKWWTAAKTCHDVEERRTRLKPAEEETFNGCHAGQLMMICRF